MTSSALVPRAQQMFRGGGAGHASAGLRQSPDPGLCCWARRPRPRRLYLPGDWLPPYAEPPCSLRGTGKWARGQQSGVLCACSWGLRALPGGRPMKRGPRGPPACGLRPRQLRAPSPAQRGLPSHSTHGPLVCPPRQGPCVKGTGAGDVEREDIQGMQ